MHWQRISNFVSFDTLSEIKTSWHCLAKCPVPANVYIPLPTKRAHYPQPVYKLMSAHDFEMKRDDHMNVECLPFSPSFLPCLTEAHSTVGSLAFRVVLFGSQTVVGPPSSEKIRKKVSKVATFSRDYQSKVSVRACSDQLKVPKELKRGHSSRPTGVSVYANRF